MPSVVLDTNVLLRALARRSGPSGLVWQRHDEYTLCSSAATIAEFAEVAARASVRAKVAAFTDDSLEEMIELLREGTCIEDPREAHVCRDPNDDKFVACALATRANFVVTNDKDLLALDGYRDLKTVTPAEFIELLDRGEER